jgi:hypothetical protein
MIHSELEFADFVPSVVMAVALAAGLLAGGCGAPANSEGADESSADTNAGGPAPRADASSEGGASDTGAGGGDTFVPEEEEFLVREVASTDDFVFVPNSGESSSTVARISGSDLSIVPIRVALEPVAVRATDLPDVGAVAYVLSEGTSAISIVRAEKIDRFTDPDRRVNVLPVPKEINSLALSPDGRHLLGYIDPDEPLPGDASVSSLQVASLVRLGSDGDDEAYQLSVSRLIRDIEFTEDGSQAFLVGRDGVNRVVLDDVSEDRFVPTLDLDLSDSAFPPTDCEVEVGPQGGVLAVRSSSFDGLALHRPPAPDAGSEAEGKTVKVSLPEPPTDIDLHAPADGPLTVIASLPNSSKVALVGIETVFSESDSGSSGDEGSDQAGVEILDAGAATPGLAQVTPDDKNVLLYTSREETPDLGLLDLASNDVSTYPVRNQIRSVAVAPTSETAVVVHEKQEGQPPDDSTLEVFQHSHGLTLFDIGTGYRRPVALRGDPAGLVMTANSQGTPLLFAMLQPDENGTRGVTRIDLLSYRTNFETLPRRPKQIGRVAGKIFVSQESEVGRITFFDVDSGERQTVSGYELNAEIE